MIPTSGLGFFVSPSGSEHPYGESPLIPVRTVAFGSIPVEATLQLIQRRDANNLPLPVRLDSQNGDRTTDITYADPASLAGQVGFRVRSLKVDGIDLRLRSTCTSRSWSRLHLVSEYWEGLSSTMYDVFDPAHGYLAGTGGTLSGDLDIPAFANCRTSSGDDVSRILTATISGPGNPVDVRIGIPTCYTTGPDWINLPPGPGDTTPEKANCFIPGIGQYPIPSNHKIVVAPGPIPFPNHAP